MKTEVTMGDLYRLSNTTMLCLKLLTEAEIKDKNVYTQAVYFD